jgi:hypothetical protein
MAGYSSEIGDKIAQSSDGLHHAQIFSIAAATKMQGSATSGASPASRLRGIHPAERRATHTDPQILFSVATS